MSTLDQISNGQFMLGAGAGWYQREFDALGVPFKGRGKLFERNLELMLRLWTEDKVSEEIGEMNIRNAVIVPKPSQKPHPPVYLGGYVDVVLKRVARLSDGWITFAYTPDDFTRSWDKVKQYAVEYGRDPSELSATMQLPIYIGPPKDEAGAELREWLSKEFDYPEWSDAKIESSIKGTPEQCAEQLQPYLAADIDRFVFIPYRFRVDQIEKIATQVIPLLNT